MSNDEFMHYGVKGMKWGVRRDPEQLGNVARVSSNLARVSGLSLSVKNMSAADIASKVVDPINPSGDRYNCAYCAVAFEMRRRGYDVTAKSNAGSSWSLDDYITKTNAYSSALTDAQKSTLSATPVVYNSSAVDAVVAYGFENEYKELLKLQESGELTEEEFDAKVRDFYAKVRDKSIEKVGEELFKALSNEPDRSRGMITMMAAGFSGGHVLSYEIIDNKPVIYDSQNKRMYNSSNNVCEYFASMENNFIINAGYTRLDNANLNIVSAYGWVDDNRRVLRHGEISDELCHYGVKGMKWGVRRYRNADGSLTAAGRRRNAKMAARLYERQKLRSAQLNLMSKGRSARQARGKSTVELDSHIKNVKRNIRNEKRFLEKTLSELTPEEIARGKKYVMAVRTAALILPVPMLDAAYISGEQLLVQRFMNEVR